MALRFTKLDNRVLRAMQPGQRATEHGITVEATKAGDLRFSVNIMVDGHRIHRVLGRSSEGVTRSTAERLIEQLRTDARADRLSLPSGRKLHRTFAEAADEYIVRMEATTGKDMVNKRRHLRQRLIPALGTLRLDKITKFRLEQYRSQRSKEGASEATINRELATFCHLVRRAASKDWGWISRESIPEIPRETETRKKIRVLTLDQCARLLDAAVADQDPRCWLFTMFGLNAAMRHSEIVCRRYDEVDFDNCRMWINRGKTGEREQPITPSLRDALLRQRSMEEDPDGWIFPAVRPGTKLLHRPDMRRAFARAVKRAGLDPRQCTPHVMRHTAITQLVKAKRDIPTIQKISGHKTPAMVLHYTHIWGPHR